MKQTKQIKNKALLNQENALMTKIQTGSLDKGNKSRLFDKQISTQIIELTKRLMTANSTKDNFEGRAEALTIAERELSEYPIERFESNGYQSILVRNVDKPTKHFKIILNSHLDVVPGNLEQFEPIEKGGKLYGRGAYDAKGSIAVMIILFKYLAKHLPYPIGLQIVTDEEVGGYNGTKYQLEQGVRAEFVVVGECGSNMRIISQAKGVSWFKLSATGKTAHAAYPWRGDNALSKLHSALTDLQKLFPNPTSEAWVNTLNLAKIETTNKTYNSIPNEATAFIDIRYTNGTPADLFKKLRQALPPEIKIETLLNEPPEYIAPDNRFVLSLQKALTEVTRKKSDLAAVNASSDLRHYNAFGNHGVEFGPVGHAQHMDNESVDIASLETYFSTLETFLIDVIDIAISDKPKTS